MVADKVLCKVFNVLDIGRPNMNEFKDRIRYQKIIYLLQNTGMSLGYGFKWYMKSPYSSELGGILYHIFTTPRLYEQSKRIKFNHNKEVMEKLCAFKNDLGSSINDDAYIDALACMHFIDMSRFSGKGNLEEIKNVYLDIKPEMLENPYIDDAIAKAYTDIVKYKN